MEKFSKIIAALLLTGLAATSLAGTIITKGCQISNTTHACTVNFNGDSIAGQFTTKVSFNDFPISKSVKTITCHYINYSENLQLVSINNFLGQVTSANFTQGNRPASGTVTFQINQAGKTQLSGSAKLQFFSSALGLPGGLSIQQCQ
jgi:hypothetical protein